MAAEHRADVIKEVGVFGLKTPNKLNSGASIVILAFLGNVFGESDPRMTIDIDLIRCAMILFLLGIGAAMASVAATYILAQLQGTGDPRVSGLSPNGFLGWLVGPAVISFIMFVAGFLSAVFSLSA